MVAVNAMGGGVLKRSGPTRARPRGFTLRRLRGYKLSVDRPATGPIVAAGFVGGHDRDRRRCAMMVAMHRRALAAFVFCVLATVAGAQVPGLGTYTYDPSGNVTSIG